MELVREISESDLMRLVITVNETRKVPVIVRPRVSGVSSFFDLNTNTSGLNETLKGLGLEKVSLKEILPKYTKIQKDQIGRQCTICHQDYKPNEYQRKLKCKHNFHKKCIDKWLKSNPSCPICRHDLL